MQLLLPLITALALSAKALAGSITGDSCLVNADVNLNVKGFLYVSLDISVCLPIDVSLNVGLLGLVSVGLDVDIGLVVGTPPKGTYCGNDWYWLDSCGGKPVHKCVPQHPHYDPHTPTCGEGYKWDEDKHVCYEPPHSSCSGWYWPHGGDCGGQDQCIPSNPPPYHAPPPQMCCPKGFKFVSWGDKVQCVPKDKYQPSCGGKPECPSGWNWSRPDRCCKKNYGHRRELLSTVADITV